MAELSVTYGFYAPSGDAFEVHPPAPGSDPVYLMDKITGLDAADRRSANEVRPAGDGLIVYPTRRGARTVVFEGYVCGSDSSDLNDKIEAMVLVLDQIDYADALVTWTPTGKGARQMSARLIDDYTFDEDPETSPYWRRFQFTLLCYSGQIVGTAPTTHTINPGDGTLTIAADGSTTKQYPLLRLYGPATGATLKVNSARKLSLSGFNLSAGNYIEIDTLAETLLVNGSPSSPITSALDLVISEMPWMRPGNSNDFDATFAGSGSGTKWEIITRPTYASG